MDLAVSGLRTDRGFRRVQSVLVPSHYCDVAPLGGEELRGGQSDPMAAAGDEGHPAGKIQLQDWLAFCVDLARRSFIPRPDRDWVLSAMKSTANIKIPPWKAVW